MKKITFLLKLLLVAPIHFAMNCYLISKGGVRFGLASIVGYIVFMPIMHLSMLISLILGALGTILSKADAKLSGMVQEEFKTVNAARLEYHKSPLFKKLKAFLHGVK